MLDRRGVRQLVFTLIVVGGSAACRGQVPQASLPAYDVPPKLVGTGVVGSAHCEIVQFDPKDTSQTKDIIVAAMVGRQGLPMNAHVVHGVGMGFDQKAFMAVRQLSFKPALKDGVPVVSPVPVYIRVTFEDTPAPAQ